MQIITQTNPTSQQKPQSIACQLHILVHEATNLSKGCQRVLRSLQYYKNKFELVFPSHDRIAHDAGVHISTVKRAIDKFISLGWLKKITRYKKSCIYLFDSIFDAQEVQRALSVLFISLALISSTLLATPKKATNRNGLLSNIKKFLFIKISQDTQEGYVAGAREKTPANLSSIQKKKDSKMSNNLEWSREVTQLHKQMPLRDHGFAKLSAFPCEAIAYARQRMPLVYKALTPFHYFVKLCEIYCEQNNLKPDWAQYKALQKQMKVTNQDDYVDAESLQKLIAEETEKPTYQQREVRQQKDKAPDPTAIQARIKQTNEYIQQQVQKKEQCNDVRKSEVVDMLMLLDISESEKQYRLSLLDGWMQC